MKVKPVVIEETANVPVYPMSLEHGAMSAVQDTLILLQVEAANLVSAI